MKKLRFLVVVLTVLAFSVPAFAHFQMIYTPVAALDKGKEIGLKLVFTHPFSAGHTMDMGQPEQFFVIHKDKKKDLLKTLKPVTWTSLSNSGKAFETSYKIRGMGDWIFALVPAPYYEKGEDIYIQQCTKMVVNAAGAPTDWDAEIGLPAEIVPYDKPYALWTGNVFRGMVKSGGKPVPFAEIEAEYINHPPVMNKNMFSKKAMVAGVPSDAHETMGIKADANGEFTVGIPKAGWWGICALGVGPKTEHKGKELSQDAVIWFQAVDMK